MPTEPPYPPRPRRQVSAIPSIRRTAPAKSARPPGKPDPARSAQSIPTNNPPTAPPPGVASPRIHADRPGGRGRRRAPKPASARVWWGVLPLALVATLIGTFQFAGGSPAAAPTAAPSTPPATTEAPTPTPRPTPPPLPALRFRATTITVPTEGFFSWALMDRRTGQIWGSDTMTGVTWPASMIKAWLAADFLRRTEEAKKQPSAADLHELEIMIRDSDNNAAEAFYRRDGGSEGIRRLIKLCKLTDTKASSKGWSFTTISARDTVRMADCIGSGTAAGDRWTSWLLDMMRKVRGEGDFGIRMALPAAEAAQVSIKNGWLFYTDDENWHINCLAVADTWALAVLQRYPGHGKWTADYQRGRGVCKAVAEQLLNPAYDPTR